MGVVVGLVGVGVVWVVGGGGGGGGMSGGGGGGGEGQALPWLQKQDCAKIETAGNRRQAKSQAREQKIILKCDLGQKKRERDLASAHSISRISNIGYNMAKGAGRDGRVSASVVARQVGSERPGGLL